MVVKEFSIKNGIDLSKYENSFMKENKVRRACLKIPGILLVRNIRLALVRQNLF